MQVKGKRIIVIGGARGLGATENEVWGVKDLIEALY
jgi:hypothetical protein